MNKIKSGCLEARVNTNYTTREFYELNNTFNDMVEQIHTLKNEAYEKELNLKKTQLQYYQIQIKPHFYLNCLKNMYAMAEVEKYDDIKKTIIYLSKHLRYMLKDEIMIVSIYTELQYVENYISLQQIGISYSLELHTQLDPDLLDIDIPAISILSFVENSIKFAAGSENGLIITIQVQLLDSIDGKFINIQICDNGQGFSFEQIEQLNHYESVTHNTDSIGINNVIERFLLYFGRENVMFTFSNKNGALIDIYIKKEECDLR